MTQIYIKLTILKGLNEDFCGNHEIFVHNFLFLTNTHSLFLSYHPKTYSIIFFFGKTEILILYYQFNFIELYK